MLSNAYFLAKFRFDTAENEPAKNLQNNNYFVNIILLILLAPPRPRSLGHGWLPLNISWRRSDFDSGNCAAVEKKDGVHESVARCLALVDRC